MRAGQSLKDNSLNNKKILIHKMPLLERIMGLFSAIVLTALQVALLFLGYEEVLTTIIILLIMLVYCFFMYLRAFKTFIWLDCEHEKIIIQNGTEKKEVSATKLISLQVEDDPQCPSVFTLNYYFVDYTEKDYGWSIGFESRVLFGTIRGQKRRLEAFCEQCNAYLSSRNLEK